MIGCIENSFIKMILFIVKIIFLISITLFVSLTSFGKIKYPRKEVNFPYDSLVIEYSFTRGSGLFYNYKLVNDGQNSSLEVRSVMLDNKIIRTTNNLDTIQQLNQYLDIFFISKSEKIVNEEKSRGYSIFGDYPMLTIKGYKRKALIFKTFQDLSEESYDMVYHPKFEQLLNILDSLSMQVSENK